MCVPTGNRPGYVAVRHFPRRVGICLYNGLGGTDHSCRQEPCPVRLQRSIEPRHSVGGAGFYFDLNKLRHCCCSCREKSLTS
jgi:hypothetical protein